MKNCLIIISALLLCSASAFAQVNKGRIVDASGALVPGVMILDTSNDKWATTDINGNYTIDAAIGHTLSITSAPNAVGELHNVTITPTAIRGHGPNAALRRVKITGNPNLINVKVD